MISIPTVPSVSFTLMITPKLRKDWHAALNGYKRIKPIKRTRKRQIARARHMMAEHDHTCYEWSQWWHKKARSRRQRVFKGN